MPISFKAASALKDSTVAIWHFHPKRPTRSAPTWILKRHDHAGIALDRWILRCLHRQQIGVGDCLDEPVGQDPRRHPKRRHIGFRWNCLDTVVVDALGLKQSSTELIQRFESALLSQTPEVCHELRLGPPTGLLWHDAQLVWLNTGPRPCSGVRLS